MTTYRVLRVDENPLEVERSLEILLKDGYVVRHMTDTHILLINIPEAIKVVGGNLLDLFVKYGPQLAALQAQADQLIAEMIKKVEANPGFEDTDPEY